MPTAEPATVSGKPSLKTSRRIRQLGAPSATRNPISGVRRRTASPTTP